MLYNKNVLALSVNKQINYTHVYIIGLQIDGNFRSTVQHKTLAGENFGGIGTARKLAEETLAVGRGKVHSLLELTRSHNILADKTLADWK